MTFTKDEEEAETREEARRKVVNKLSMGNYEFGSPSSCISDGIEID